jgi:hypothetical protein
MADGQETEIVQTEPGTLQDVLNQLGPNVGVESTSEVEGEPDAPETPEAERETPADEGEEAEVTDGEEAEDELEETAAAVEEVEESEEGEPEDEPAPEDEVVTVTLGELEIEVDKEGAEAIHELQKEANRAMEFAARADVVEQQARKNTMDADRLAIMEDELRADPVGFLAEKISPALRTAVAEDLLLDDEVWKVMVDKVDEWRIEDSQRQVAAERRRADRAEFKNQIEDRKTQVREGRENAWELRDQVKEMGQTLPERRRLVWERAAIARLQEHVKQAEQSGKQINRIDPTELDLVLADEIEAFGINAGEAPAEPSGQKKPATYAGEKFRAKTRKRKKVTSTAPVGAGAGPARREQYKDMSLGDALKSLSQG